MGSEVGISGDDFRFLEDSALGSATADNNEAIKSSSAMALGAGRYVDVLACGRE